MTSFRISVSWERLGDADGDPVHTLGPGEDVATFPGAAFIVASTTDERRRALDVVHADSSAALIGRCRIENETELRRDLGLPSGVSLGQFLLAAFRRWDLQVGDRLRGDFAIVAWDWRRRRLVGLTDPFGVNPLFHGTGPGGFAIASTIEGVIATNGRRPTPDHQIVAEHLLGRYRTRERTFVDGVERVVPGNALVVHARRSSLVRYWSPPLASFAIRTREEAYGEFRVRFEQAISRRRDASAPTVAHLSGGADSSSIVCVADRLIRGQGGHPVSLVAASAIFPGLPCDETEYIRAVAEVVGCPVETFDGCEPDWSDLEAPVFAGPGMRVSSAGGGTGDLRLAHRRGATVLLSGTGGDQVGSPLGVLADQMRRHPVAFVWDSVRGLDLPRVGRRARWAAKQLAPAGFLRRLRSLRGPGQKPAFLTDRAWHAYVLGVAKDDALTEAVPFASEVVRHHWRTLTSARMVWIVDRERRAAAGHGIDVRFPFLDRDLVDFILSVPHDLWPAPQPWARFHREALRGLLPELVYARRTKASFSPAVARRISLGSSLIRSIFCEDDWASAPYVDRHAAQSLLSRALSAGDSSDWEVWRPLWAIATLEAWLRSKMVYAAAHGA